MNSYLQPNVIIPVLIAAIGVAVWYFYNRYFRKNKSKQQLDTSNDNGVITYESINVRLADNITGKIYNTQLPGAVVRQIMTDYKTLGRVWDRYGKKVYAINKFVNDQGEEKYRPDLMPKSMGDSPVSLYGDMQHPEVAVIYGEALKEDKSFVEKWGKLIWWLAVIGFIIAIMINGGK